MAGTDNIHCAIEALKILTRADHGHLLVSSDSDKCRFDQLLIGNAKTLTEKLETDIDWSSFKSYWMADSPISVPHKCSSRWDFVLFCLKSLHLLQENLKSNLAEYQKQKPENIRPSGAPPVSPDTLSFEEQKVVLTAVQFIVCLGISPNLDKGVGIPIEMRSEFSKLIQVSNDEDKIKEVEKRWRLYICLKVFISCIFTPSLGSVILSRHLTDILAGLLQLTHSLKSVSTKAYETGTKDDSTSIAESDNVQGIKQTDNKCSLSETSCESSVKDTANKTVKEDSDLPLPSEITPASIVDHVRKTFQEMEESADKKHDTTSAKLEACVRNGEEKIHTATSTAYTAEIEGNKEDQISSGQCEIDVGFCERVLEDLIEKIYPPLLVKTLLLLQGGPRSKKTGGDKCSLPPAPVWLRKICGRQLTAIIMKPKGVQSVLRGMLDAPGEGKGMSQATDWRKCDAVAKVISCCPMQSVSVESYYKTVGPQIIEILHIADKQVAKQFLRVACSTISSMVVEYPELTKTYLITPLIQPLLRCTENSEGMPDTDHTSILVDEGQLSSCVEDCHRVFVSGTTANPQLIECLQPVILTLFQLLVFTKPGVSALKTACHEVIVCYLKATELKMKLNCLELMAFQMTKKTNHGFIKLHSNVVFSHGSSGGVVAIYEYERSVQPPSQDVCVQCMVDLLKDLQSDGTAGEFLIYMLQELTDILKIEVEGDTDSTPQKSSCSEGEVLMQIETDYQSKEEQFFRKLTLLNLLATVCESIGPSCIKNTKNTLEFVRATLERAVQVCKATADPVFEVFENETLTMAMGLLTAILTGAMQVTSEDRKTMENLLPLLQDICDNHPESSVQEMASDLRIAIATHGAVWSEVMKSNAEDFKELKTKIQQNVGKQRVPTKKEPVIEVISDNHDKIRQETGVSEGQDAADSLKKKQKKEIQEKRQKMAHELQKTTQNRDDRDLNKTKLSDVKELNTNELQVETTRSVITDGKRDSEILRDYESWSSKDKEKTKPNRLEGKSDELEAAFKELCDPLIPVRGHGLIRLTRLVQGRDKEAYDKKETILKIFEENLDHTDSYMYLSSVNGLAAMSDIFPDLVVPRICEQFANFDREEKKRSSELRMKLGEIMVKASRNLGDTILKYRDLLINTVLTGAKDADSLVRASSLSNLGEICKLLHFSLGKFVHEVFLCCKSLLKSDSDSEVRKAAAVALTLVLQGLGPDILKVLDTVLLDLYRLLKQVMTTEKDDSVKLNASLALNELEDIMKSVIFPQQKLEKRIRVLDMD